MKKFLISIIVSVVMVTAGAMTFFFELSDFEIVEGKDFTPYEESAMKSTTLNVKDASIIIDSDDYLNIEWRYDDSMKDEVKIMTSPYLSMDRHNNYININTRHYSFKDAVKIGEYILNGLKKHEIRIHDHDHYGFTEVIIICSKDNMSNIVIND